MEIDSLTGRMDLPAHLGWDHCHRGRSERIRQPWQLDRFIDARFPFLRFELQQFRTLCEQWRFQ